MLLLLLLTIPSRLLAMKIRYNVVLYCIMLCVVYMCFVTMVGYRTRGN